MLRYSLKPDDAILADEARLPLYEELVREHKVEYHGGGDTLNVMKCAQWLMQHPRATAYIGCIGSFGASGPLSKWSSDQLISRSLFLIP